MAVSDRLIREGRKEVGGEGDYLNALLWHTHKQAHFYTLTHTYTYTYNYTYTYMFCTAALAAGGGLNGRQLTKEEILDIQKRVGREGRREGGREGRKEGASAHHFSWGVNGRKEWRRKGRWEGGRESIRRPHVFVM